MHGVLSKYSQHAAMLAGINHLERKVKMPLSINHAELYVATCNALTALHS